MGEDNIFGNLENADMSGVPNDLPENLNPQEFTKMAMNMAKRMKPQDIAGLRNQIQNMPLDLKMIPILLQMNQYEPLKFMLRGKNDPQLPQALDMILDLAKDATKHTKTKLAQLVLSISPLLDVSAQHAQAQILLDQARAQNTKSAKSMRIRAKRERVRKMRLNEKKKK